jgi:iron complex outermembrane receptor protein
VILSAGMAWSPSDRFTLTLDGYSIMLSDRILLTGYLGGPAIEAILQANNVQAEAGQYFTNIVDTRTTGIDITGSYRRTIGTSGVLNVNTGINYTTNEIDGQRENPPELNGCFAPRTTASSTRRPGSAAPANRPSARGRSSTLKWGVSSVACVGRSACATCSTPSPNRTRSTTATGSSRGRGRRRSDTMGASSIRGLR